MKKKKIIMMLLIGCFLLTGAIVFAGGQQEKETAKEEKAQEEEATEEPQIVKEVDTYVKDDPMWPVEELGPKKDFSNLAGKTVKVTMDFHDFLYQQFYSITGKEFEKMYADINFEWDIRQVPYEDLHDRLMVSLVAGKGAPDIVGIEISQWGRVWKGPYQALVPLELKRDNLYNEFIESRLIPYTGPDGKVYGLPSDTPVTVMFYNKSLFDKAGIKMPVSTWDQFIQEAQKLKAMDVYALGFIRDGWDQYWELLLQNGGGFFDKNGNIIANNETAIETLQFLSNLVNEYEIAYPIDDFYSATGVASMNNERVAAVTRPTWYLKYYMKEFFSEEQVGKWRAAPLPAFKKGGVRTGSQGGTAMAITDQSEHPELLYEYLKYTYATYENQIRRWQIMNYMPTMKEALDAPEVVNLEDDFLGGQRVGALFAELAKEVPEFYMTPDWPGLTTAMSDRFNEVMDGDLNPKEFLDWVVNEIK